jgi:transcriptional regulator with XRE-family HTH domain
MNNNVRQRIGTQLRALREAKGLTTRELAELADIDHSHIAKIERGAYNLRVDTLYKVATALGAVIKIETPESLCEWRVIEEVKKWGNSLSLHLTHNEDDWVFIDFKNYKITVAILEVCDESGIYTELSVTAYNNGEEKVEFNIPVDSLTSPNHVHLLLDKFIENLL